MLIWPKTIAAKRTDAVVPSPKPLTFILPTKQPMPSAKNNKIPGGLVICAKAPKHPDRKISGIFVFELIKDLRLSTSDDLPKRAKFNLS